MAKYKLKNKGRKVNCEVLHESENSYVVKFENGVIQKVPKGRVSELDHIDEAVISAVQQKRIDEGFGDGIRSLGSKIYNKGKEFIQKVGGFFAKVFNINNFAIFTTEDGEVLSASHPMNCILGAKMINGVSFTPSDDTVEMCEEVGIAPEAVQDEEFSLNNSGEYTGAFDFAPFVAAQNESVDDEVSDMLYEARESETIKLRGTFRECDEAKLVKLIFNEYKARYAGKETAALPFMIWGAPGIGKTAIIRSLKALIKEKFGESINVLSVNGGNIGQDDFTLPAVVTQEVRDKLHSVMDQSKASKDTIKDMPKSWLPVYDTTDKANEKINNAIANGAKKNEDDEYPDNGPGGIFFIDEFSRLSQAGVSALMQTPTTREIGGSSELHFGDRWVIVCAANRKSDMSDKAQDIAMEFEAASKTRFNHVNFVPKFDDWVAWAKKSTKKGYKQNIIPEIISYLTDDYKKHASQGSYGDFYNMWTHPEGELDVNMPTACPRTWEAASDYIVDQILEDDDAKYKNLCDYGKGFIVEELEGIIGKEVAQRFADFVSQFSLFTSKDAENVWRKGDAVTYDILKKQKLNSANIEDMFENHIFPVLLSSYPGGLDLTAGDKISPDAALNFIKFLEACCYEGGKFNLNRFKTISQNFSSSASRYSISASASTRSMW